MKAYLAFIGLALVACSSTTMELVTYDPATGRKESKVFSKFFEGSKVLAESSAGIVVLVELAPSNDLTAAGSATAVIYNLSQDVLSIEITSIAYQQKEVRGFPRSLRIEPHTHEALQLGSLGVLSYADTLELEIVSSIGARPSAETIVVERQTISDIRARSGPDGIRPRLAWKP